MPFQWVDCSKEQCELDDEGGDYHDCQYDDCARRVFIGHDGGGCTNCQLAGGCNNECHSLEDPMPEIDLDGDCDHCHSINCDRDTDPADKLCKKTAHQRADLVADWNEGYRYLSGQE